MTDSALHSVKCTISKLPDVSHRTGRVLRETYDQIYDGQRTGRFRVESLFKTEKTHFGSLVEINLRREFDQDIHDGRKMDFLIAGVEVDCKFSRKMGGWMIPREAHGEICLVIWAEDTGNPSWSMGLVRASTRFLNTGGNQDKKVTLNKDGMKAVEWLFKDEPMPPNVLLQLAKPELDLIFGNQESGQQRINMLFRVAQKQRIGRAVIATVAQQADYMKRVRGNGGARTLLKPEGIIIFGDYRSHRRMARELQLPEPEEGEFVAARVFPVKGARRGTIPATLIEGTLWRLAGEADPVVPAPDLSSL